MRLSDIMETGVDTIEAGEPAEQAWQHMRDHRNHHLVVMQAGRVAGVVSARDLGSARNADWRAGRSAQDVMTGKVVTATPRTTVREAANLMRGRSIGCLPVLDGRKLVGIVTVTDLLELLGKGAERPMPRGRRAVMAGRGHRRKPANLPGRG